MVDDNTTVTMTDPSGQQYTLPKSSASIAEGKGWKYVGEEPDAPPTPEEQEAVEKLKGSTSFTTYPNTPEEQRILDKKLLNEATYGVSNPLLHAGETPHDRAVREAEEKEVDKRHPIESFLYPAVGFGASLLAPGIGEVGKLAEGAVRGGEGLVRAGEEAATHFVEATPRSFIGGVEGPLHVIPEVAAHEVVDRTANESIGRLIAGKVAGNVAQAEAYGLPSQIANYAVGDHDTASESLLWSLGLGGLLGAGSGLARVAADKLGPIIAEHAPQLKEVAGELANSMAAKLAGLKWDKMTDFEKERFVNRTQEIGQYGNRIDRETKEEIRQEAGAAIKEHKDYLDQKVEELNDQKIPDRRDALGNPIPSNQITDPLEARLSDLSAATGEKAGPNGIHEFGPNPTELADRLENDINCVRPGLLNNPLQSLF